MTVARTLTAARAYYDTSDPRNEGWAYRLYWSDDHEESGPMDADTDDHAEVLTELRAMVASYGGSGEPEAVNCDGYRWSAE
jgi:hypothetical protein